MPPSEVDPLPESIPPVDSLPVFESPDTSLTSGPTIHRQLPSVRDWILTITAGLIAGFAAWLITETFHDRLQPMLLTTGGVPTPEEASVGVLSRVAAVTLQVTLSFGTLGAALGLALGVAGGTVRGSIRAAIIAACFGTIVGASAGALMSRVLLPIHFRFYNPDQDDLALAILIQGGICSVIGAAGGAAYGIGLGRSRNDTLRTLLGGLLGALVGVLIYQVLGALAFPLDATTKPLAATSATRLFAKLAVTVLASIGATKGA